MTHSFAELRKRATPLATGYLRSKWPIPEGQEPGWMVLSGDAEHVLLLCQGSGFGVALVDGEVVAKNATVSRPVGVSLQGGDFAFQSTDTEGEYAHVGKKRWGPFPEVGVSRNTAPFLFRISEENGRGYLLDGKVQGPTEEFKETWTEEGWIICRGTPEAIQLTWGNQTIGPFESMPRVLGLDQGQPVYLVKGKSKERLFRANTQLLSCKDIDSAAVRGGHVALAKKVGKNQVEVALDGKVLLSCKNLRSKLTLIDDGRCLFTFDGAKGAGFFDGELAHEGFACTEGPWMAGDGTVMWLAESMDWTQSMCFCGRERIILPASADYESGDDFVALSAKRLLCVVHSDDNYFVCCGSENFGPMWLTIGTGPKVMANRSREHWAALFRQSSDSDEVYALHDGRVYGPFPKGWAIRYGVGLDGSLTVAVTKPDGRPCVEVWQFPPA
jgi:hypothetical protein